MAMECKSRRPLGEHLQLRIKEGAAPSEVLEVLHLPIKATARDIGRQLRISDEDTLDSVAQVVSAKLTSIASSKTGSNFFLNDSPARVIAQIDYMISTELLSRCKLFVFDLSAMYPTLLEVATPLARRWRRHFSSSLSIEQIAQDIIHLSLVELGQRWARNPSCLPDNYRALSYTVMNCEVQKHVARIPKPPIGPPPEELPSPPLKPESPFGDDTTRMNILDTARAKMAAEHFVVFDAFWMNCRPISQVVLACKQAFPSSEFYRQKICRLVVEIDDRLNSFGFSTYELELIQTVRRSEVKDIRVVSIRSKIKASTDTTDEIKRLWQWFWLDCLSVEDICERLANVVVGPPMSASLILSLARSLFVSPLARQGLSTCDKQLIRSMPTKGGVR